jgi:hypothetical protein
MKGVKHPNACKFPIAVDSVALFEAIEIIPCTDIAIKSISEVPEWKA